MQLVEDIEVLCNDGRLVIPKKLQHRAVQWYHHYLQHPGHTRLEETLRAAMHWKGMRSTVRAYVKKCHSCQVNKRKSKKYGKLPPKLVVTNPWECLCVDLIGPYTLRGKDGTEIDFMCLTMIDPATSWFEVVELPLKELIQMEPSDPKGTKTKKGRKRKRGNDETLSHKETHDKMRTKEPYFDKSSATVGSLVNRTWF